MQTQGITSINEIIDTHVHVIDRHIKDCKKDIRFYKGVNILIVGVSATCLVTGGVIFVISRATSELIKSLPGWVFGVTGVSVNFSIKEIKSNQRQIQHLNSLKYLLRKYKTTIIADSVQLANIQQLINKALEQVIANR